MQITYASVGLLAGRPEPEAGFPPGTRFLPYATLRNTTTKPLLVTPVLHYMTASQPVSRPLSEQELGPLETRQIDFQSLLGTLYSQNFSVNLTLSFSGQAGDLIVATGSVDGTGTYVFEVLPQGVVAPSLSKEVHYWTVANGLDTMFALWNPSEEAQDIDVTFYYGDGSGSYRLPVSLLPKGSLTIDMAKLIAVAQPDPEGNVIPTGVREGSVSFASARGMTEPMNLAISSGILNVRNATCGANCVDCCGYSGFVTTPYTPFFSPFRETRQFGAQATYCTGTIFYFTSQSSWSSSNTAVATVETQGNSNPGLLTGVEVGDVTIQAVLPTVFVYTGNICSGGSPVCPQGNPSASSGGQVAPTVSIQVEAGKSQVSGTGFVVLSASQSLTTNLTGVGSPSGGTFQWSVGSRLQFVGPSNTMNVSVKGTSASTSQEDTFVSVTYTVNGIPNRASVRFTVRDPRTLTNYGFTGGLSQTMQVANGYSTDVTYFVEDQFNSAIQVGGIDVTEVLSTTSVSHPVSFQPPDGVPLTAQTNSNASIIDHLWVTGPAPGGVPDGFDARRNQNFTVTGFGFSPTQTQDYDPTFARVSRSSVSK
ncbi:MAG: Ig-like domain-containing protein [Acidobacteriota bacterium]